MQAPQTEITVRHEDAVISRRLVPPGEYIIGRDSDADIVIGVGHVSRQHARLTINFSEVFVEDLGSSNGTLINGVPVTGPTRLWPTQRVQVGDATIELRRLRPSEGVYPFAPLAADLQRYLPPEFLRERKYEIGTVVGQGGMGAILSAKQATVQRKVAIKVLLNQGSPEDLLRFIEEAQITGQLEHPNIVPVHELGVDENDQVYYTMKFVQGVTLKEVLERIKRGDAAAIAKYPLRRLLNIFLRVCDGIAFAHSKGVVHRDLKPDNIMLGDFGEVLVMDWGLAKLIGDAAASNAGAAAAGGDAAPETAVTSVRHVSGDFNVTLSGAVMGTPHFMAPEQVDGQIDRIDQRTDIFALGGILYNILTLDPPAAGGSLEDIFHTIRSGKITPPSTFNRPRQTASSERSPDQVSAMQLPHCPGRRIPDSLSAVAMKALSVEAGNRYQSVTEMRNEIDAYLGGFATAAEQAGFGRQMLLLLNRHRAVATSILFSVLTLLVVVAVFVAQLADQKQKAIATLNDLRNTAGTFYEQTLVLIEQQRFEEAREKISRACSIDPEKARYRIIEGNLYQTLGQFDKAEQSYLEALAVSPGNQVAEQSLALTRKIIEDNFGGTNDLSLASLTQLIEAMRKQERFAEAVAMIGRLGNQREALYETWMDRIRKLTGWDAATAMRRFRIEPGAAEVFHLDLQDTGISDLYSLRGLPLRSLNVSKTKVTDLTPLRGMPLEMLNLRGTGAADLRPLQEMRSLKVLIIGQTPVRDLSPLTGLDLTELQADFTGVSDVGALRESTLERLSLDATGVAELAPLASLPLRFLSLNRTKVTDLAPLTGMEIESLYLALTDITDISPLRGMPLKTLWLAGCQKLKSIEPLEDCSTIEELTVPVAFRDVDFQAMLPNLKRLTEKPTLRGGPGRDVVPVPGLADFLRQRMRPDRKPHEPTKKR